MVKRDLLFNSMKKVGDIIYKKMYSNYGKTKKGEKEWQF